MAMTLRDNGKSEIKLLGPSNLSDFIHATRFFLYHESLKFDCVGFTGSDGEEYKDENLTIWPVVINGRYDQSVLLDTVLNLRIQVQTNPFWHPF